VHRLARLVLLCAALLPAHPLAREGVIYTTSYPLYHFASVIGGDALEVVFPAPPDVDPAYWKPGVDVLLAYQQADLILLNGAGFET
jgi:zinc transport system substrate-binding protein